MNIVDKSAENIGKREEKELMEEMITILFS